MNVTFHATRFLRPHYNGDSRVVSWILENSRLTSTQPFKSIYPLWQLMHKLQLSCNCFYFHFLFYSTRIVSIASWSCIFTVSSTIGHGKWQWLMVIYLLLLPLPMQEERLLLSRFLSCFTLFSIFLYTITSFFCHCYRWYLTVQLVTYAHKKRERKKKRKRKRRDKTRAMCRQTRRHEMLWHTDEEEERIENERTRGEREGKCYYWCRSIELTGNSQCYKSLMKQVKVTH